MYLLNCAKYVAFVSFSGFILGMLLPKNMFNETKFPFKSFNFENNGKYYEKFKIKKWKDKLPDMSKIFPRLIEEKTLDKPLCKRKEVIEKIAILVKETCVAEFIHVCLCIAGLYCMNIWSGFGGLVCSLLNIAGNLPFILIQRYNRPRLVTLINKNMANSEVACSCTANGK